MRNLLLFCILMLNTGLVYAGNVNMTSYYPSPTGNYDQITTNTLTVENKLSLGNSLVNHDATWCNGRSTGEVYMDGSGMVRGCIMANNTYEPVSWIGLQSGNEKYLYANPDDTKIGIGIHTPAAKLDVQGTGGRNVDVIVNGRIQTGDPTGHGGMYLDGARTLFVGQDDSGNAPAGTKALGLWNNGWRMSVASDGNVGIGNSTPAAKLDINGNMRMGINFYFDGNDDAWLRLRDRDDGAYNNFATGQLWSHKATYLAMESNLVNVGIGNLNPQAKLDVAGDARVSGSMAVGGDASVGNNANVGRTLTAGGIQVPFTANPTCRSNNGCIWLEP